ncbi:GDSL-like Lipase/Acylhydrolase [Aquimarina amphilecti]|uniref:GDSL-like Lipase/Acylhydrolase n=1 Tax=Aquimarina amphilecti TaxID=1038014 RepID=A0A1H7T0I8_AQUAM|nr:GDSL-type esterase/lipase family protein [Aquimarina amphilecti]SEL77796.1 GDSL-like Lipase/Acylhydrolase [Aquimarina amphilecti]
MKHSILYLYFFLVGVSVVGQDYVLDTIQDKYTFINWKANRIKFVENSPSFTKLFHKLDTIARGNDEDVHIFHIGGSHIQADIYSNRLRTYLQQMSPTAKGQRGFIYPYKIASTNNPSNYSVEYDGNWKGYRCSIRKDSVAWGMAGVTAVFKDSISNIKIKANHRGYDAQQYNFNRIRIFYDNWSEDYEIFFKESGLIADTKVNKEAHFIEFVLTRTLEELEFCVQRIGNPETPEFLMMGMELMNDNRGVEYTTIGVNGASFSYYDRCKYFNDQLMLYKPDLFIVSVGTNDAYHPDFDPEEYRVYYENLILNIQKANPDCAVLLTVPNDSYYKKKYPNPRTRLMQKIIYELAKKHKMAVWDFYEIMGGYNSSKDWYQNKLMPRDRIHFTQLGYRIKADLLLQALTNSWEKELQLAPNSVLNQIINE